MLVRKQFWVRPGIASLPGGVPTVFWGIATNPTAAPQLPGPVIEARVGDTVEITLHNRLNEPVCLIFPGQDLTPDPVLDGNGRLISLDRPADPGRSVVYSFPVSRPGTFRYEGGTGPERQVQMGLYGALIVRPADYDGADPTLRTAYGADTGSGYDVEALIILSELDPAAHDIIPAGTPYNPLGYAPRYWLINGRPFPDCIAPPDTSTQPLTARVHVLSGARVLLRVINAGFLPHTLAIAGGPARVIAEDAWPRRNALLDASYLKNAVTIGPGQTCDLVYTPPAGEQYLYDRELLHLVNSDEYPGGMMTIIDVRATFPVNVPPDPSGLAAAAVVPGQVDLTWITNGSGADGFVIERRAGPAGAFLRVATLIGQATSYTDRAVEGNTTYTYRILAFNAAGTSGYSNEATVTTPIVLEPPSNLVATAIAATEVKLTWRDNSLHEDGFRIERRTASSLNFVEIASVPANVTSYVDTGLHPGTTYTYRVRAYKAAVTSDYSNVSTATTPSIPNAPSNLVAEVLPEGRIRLTWDDNSTNEDGFIIERQDIFTNFTEIARVGPNVTAYEDSPPYAWYLHVYRVRAFNAYGVSPPSNAVGAGIGPQ